MAFTQCRCGGNDNSSNSGGMNSISSDFHVLEQHVRRIYICRCVCRLSVLLNSVSLARFQFVFLMIAYWRRFRLKNFSHSYFRWRHDDGGNGAIHTRDRFACDSSGEIAVLYEHSLEVDCVGTIDSEHENDKIVMRN